MSSARPVPSRPVVDFGSALALAAAFGLGAGAVAIARPMAEQASQPVVSLPPGPAQAFSTPPPPAPAPQRVESPPILAPQPEPATQAAWPPKFEDYAVVRDAMFHGTPATPDWDSDADAWNYRTRFRNGLKAGPNFAGEIAVVQWGCGTSCQVARFANARTGFVYSDWVNTSSGVHFRPNSLLFITNPPGTQCPQPCDHATCEQPRYFFWDKGALFEIQPPEKK